MMLDLCGYHWWADRRLFDVAAALGDEVCAREIGTPPGQISAEHAGWR